MTPHDLNKELVSSSMHALHTSCNTGYKTNLHDKLFVFSFCADMTDGPPVCFHWMFLNVLHQLKAFNVKLAPWEIMGLHQQSHVIYSFSKCSKVLQCELLQCTATLWPSVDDRSLLCVLFLHTLCCFTVYLFSPKRFTHIYVRSYLSLWLTMSHELNSDVWTYNSLQRGWLTTW